MISFVGMEQSIIEFKARCADHDRIRGLLKAKGARFVGTDHQVDTYFRTPQGRLKLREGEIENSLVSYLRPNQSGPKQSEVTLSPVPPNSGIKSVLAKALGVLAVVDKKREIYFVENVKIHLDDVAGLGRFVEVEAIGKADEVEKLQAQCDEFLREFGLQASQFEAGSYSDLVLARART